MAIIKAGLKDREDGLFGVALVSEAGKELAQVLAAVSRAGGKAIDMPLNPQQVDQSRLVL